MSTDSTDPTIAVVSNAAPIPLADLRERLVMLRNYGVREYSDGGLHLVLATERPAQVHTYSVAQGVLADPVNQAR